MVTLVAESIFSRAGTKGVGIALGLADFGDRGWVDLTVSEGIKCWQR